MGFDDHFFPSPAVSEMFDVGDGFLYFSIDYDPGWGILAAFKEALRKHVQCSRCGAPPQADFSSCPCGVEGPDFYGDYRASADVWRSELEPLWKKDRRRAWDWVSRANRREAIAESDEPAYSKADIELLRAIQDDVCYYCGASISEGFQVDHLEPLALGGSNGIRNIMLACSSCNRSKWIHRETKFWRKLRKRLPEGEYHRVREAAKTMKREKRRRLRERG